MSLDTPSWTEPITEPDILADIAALPTEDDLPSDDGEPMETPRHRDQMISLIYSLKTHWANRTNYYVSGNMFLYYDPQSPDPHSEAEACFLKAIDIAQKQQAKSLELRATMSLAQLWQQQGKTKLAHKKLSKVYHWFTEGFDTKDLQEAKALLEEFGGVVRRE